MSSVFRKITEAAMGRIEEKEKSKGGHEVQLGGFVTSKGGLFSLTPSFVDRDSERDNNPATY